MRQIGFAIGIILLVLAASTAVAQLLSLWATGAYEPVSLGSIWYALHANSLVGFQGVVERSLGALAWTPLRWLLTLPAWITLTVPGLLLAFLCRPRQRTGLGSL